MKKAVWFFLIVPALSQAGSLKAFENNETCTIMDHLPEATYSEKDQKIETKLCEEALAVKSSRFTICPKAINTNPAIEIFELDQATSKASFEKQNCRRDESEGAKSAIKKIGKFKSSVTCSYTPSILSYYHLSRYFGGILNVPPAVIRTLEVKIVLEQTEKIKKMVSDPSAIIRRTWAGLERRLKNPNSDKLGRFLFANENRDIFGAVVYNPRGESHFTEYMNEAGGHQMDRAEAFKKEDIFRDLSNSQSSLADLLSLRAPEVSNSQISQDRISRFYLLRDFSDMIVLDTLLTQEDRYNNIAREIEYKMNQASDPDRELDLVKLKERDYDQSNPRHFKIVRVVLKDNDCGVSAEPGLSRRNINNLTHIADSLAHIRPTTYSRLMKLSQDLLSPKMKTFFESETLMSSRDFAQFKETATRLARIFREKCKSGTLKLDLDLESYLQTSTSSQNCE